MQKDSHARSLSTTGLLSATPHGEIRVELGWGGTMCTAYETQNVQDPCSRMGQVFPGRVHPQQAAACEFPLAVSVTIKQAEFLTDKSHKSDAVSSRAGSFRCT